MRFAVLGCGSIGRRHMQNLCALGHSDFLAFDPMPAAREAVEEEYGIKCFDLLDDLWERKPNVALITSPSNLHVKLALAAALHDCHLLIEKPLSHSLDGVDKLLGMVKRQGLVTMVGCNMRFHPGPSLVRRLIDEQAVGDVIAARLQTGSYLPAWRPGLNYRDSYSASAQRGGGAILDCIHEIDLALWYFGPGRVAGAVIQHAKSLELEVEGLAELLIRHDGGVVSNVHLNFIQRDYRRCCQVIGENGTIYWDFEHPFVEVRTSQSEAQRYDLDPDWKTNQMYVDEMSYFIRCIEKNEQTFSTAEDGMAALRIALAAKEMGASGNGEEQQPA